MGIYIYGAVLDLNLNLSNKLVLSQIIFHTETNAIHCCWASEETIARETRYSKRTVERSIKALDENDYINIFRFNMNKDKMYRHNVYTLTQKMLDLLRKEKPNSFDYPEVILSEDMLESYQTRNLHDDYSSKKFKGHDDTSDISKLIEDIVSYYKKNCLSLNQAEPITAHTRDLISKRIRDYRMFDEDKLTNRHVLKVLDYANGNAFLTGKASPDYPEPVKLDMLLSKKMFRKAYDQGYGNNPGDISLSDLIDLDALARQEEFIRKRKKGA